MPSRLVFIAGQLCVGGAEQQLFTLLAGLDKSRFLPGVISLGLKPIEYWTEPIRKLDIPVWHIPQRLGKVGRTFRISSLLRSLKALIVHGWVLHTNPYAALAGRIAGIPIRLGSIRGNYKGIPPDKLIRWSAFRGLDALTTNSMLVATEMRDLGLTKARVEAVPNGVEIRDEIVEIERSRLKAELGFVSNDVVIGTIGRIDKNKNHAMILRVFAQLTQKWPNLKLVILGEGPLKNELASAANALGVGTKVSLPGEIPIAARYLPVMEICCLTSYTEGMPNVIMEASAAGVPVVATTCGGSTELIEESTTGFLVTVDDDASMKAKLEFLLVDSDRRHRIGAAGRKKMMRQFSVDIMVNRMTQIYEELIATKVHP